MASFHSCHHHLMAAFALPTSSAFVKLATVFVALAVWIVLHQWKHRNRKGPRSWPVIGAVMEHAAHRQNFHDYITEYCRKYTTITVPYPGLDYVYTVDPANVEYMLKTNFDNFVKGQFHHERLKEFFGDGIFNADGLTWKQQRKVASFEFSSKALRDFSEHAFRDRACKLAKLIVLEIKAHGQVEMQDLLMRMTFDSICKVGFGVDMGTLLQNPPQAQLAFSNAFDRANANVFWRYVDPLWKLKRWLRVGVEAQFAKDIRTIDSFISSLIVTRKNELRKSNGSTKPDLLSRFLSLNESDAKEFSDGYVRDILLNFMIAGRDTTALALTWFFYLLSNNPRVEERLIQEILHVDSGNHNLREDEGDDFQHEERIRSFAALLTYEKLSKMHYLHACLSEALRLYPSVPIDSKVAVSATTLPDGTRLRKGDLLSFAPYAMGRMESIWGDDAKEFKPERFLKDGVYLQESPYKFTAFQAGPRVCLGKDFAYLQMKVTVAVLLRFFVFRIVPGHTVQYKVMLTLHLAGDGLKMHAFPRSCKVISL